MWRNFNVSTSSLEIKISVTVLAILSSGMMLAFRAIRSSAIRVRFKRRLSKALFHFVGCILPNLRFFAEVFGNIHMHRAL
jgi:hypothetical protein